MTDHPIDTDGPGGAPAHATRSMLRLRNPTDAGWAARVLPHLDELLVEQAHLEKKAASAAITYLFRYPEHVFLQVPLSELAREELEHFEQTMAILERRGIAFGRQKPGPYAGRLLAIVRDKEPARLLDQMLCNATIEARSCERMKVLSEALVDRDPELAGFYHALVVSEARHHALYVRLAERIFDPAEVRARLDEVLDHEGDVIAKATPLPRLHNG